MIDCLIIGGGPAGLTAAVYLARFRRRVVVIDSGASRAEWIPVSHNLMGFPQGLGGAALLERLRVQASEYCARLVAGEVSALEVIPGGFAAHYAGGVIEAARVLLATGGLDVEPDLPGLRHAVQAGYVRYCPICDAYEVIGRRVGLIAYGKCRVMEALLLRAYTADLTVLTLGQPMSMSEPDRAVLMAAGIGIVESPVTALDLQDGRIAAFQMEGGAVERFDTLYSALGTRVRSGLATGLGAMADEDGALFVDGHQLTSVEGLFAAGDVVRGLSQIAVAAGQAAVAAVHINRSLPFPRA